MSLIDYQRSMWNSSFTYLVYFDTLHSVDTNIWNKVRDGIKSIQLIFSFFWMKKDLISS